MASATDDLYKLPLDQFTAARDALAARLKATGDADGAAAVKRLRKPSLPVWAANQVVWHAEPLWHRLRAAAAAMREQHQRASTADALRRVATEQREALLAAEARAGQLLAEHGHADSPAVRQKVGHTLLALAYGEPGATPGAVEQELGPPGFEALGGMTLPAPETVPPRVAPKPAPVTATAHAREKSPGRAAERRARAEAKARHAAARMALLRARTDVTKAEEKCQRLEAELLNARRAREAAREELGRREDEESAARLALDNDDGATDKGDVS